MVTCHYVITSTSILFKALFYSKVVNNWRRSQTEKSLLNFFIFFTSEVVHSRIFLTLYVRVCCRFGLRIFIDPPSAVHLCWPESSSKNYVYIYTRFSIYLMKFKRWLLHYVRSQFSKFPVHAKSGLSHLNVTRKCCFSKFYKPTERQISCSLLPHEVQ